MEIQMEQVGDDLDNIDTGIKIIDESDGSLTADTVLEKAIGECDDVLVIGVSDEGFYFASNLENPNDAYVLADMFKKFILENNFG